MEQTAGMGDAGRIRGRAGRAGVFLQMVIDEPIIESSINATIVHWYRNQFPKNRAVRVTR